MAWKDEDMEVLSKAMIEARKRFNEFLNEELELNNAYFDLKLIGYAFDVNLEPMKKIEMDFRFGEKEGE